MKNPAPCHPLAAWRALARFSTLLLALSCLGRAAAQTGGNGTLAGVVSDPAGYVTGATVRVDGTGLSDVTDRMGRFRIEGVAAGAQRITVDYLGYRPGAATVQVPAGAVAETFVTLEPDEVVKLAAFTVEGLREGQSRAINQQRTASTLKNIVSSDAIGNLPDRTVGEALNRLPGVNVVDDSWASIRGTAAQFNAVTLDGDRLATSGNAVASTSTTDDNRAVDLSLIPSEMVGGIEVIKVLTPDMDADSFGGTVNLVTRSAFDLKERTLNGKAEYLHNNFKRKHGYAGTLTYMDVLNEARTVGVSATLSYRDEDRWSDSYEFLYYDPAAIPIGTSGSGTAGAIAAVGDQGVTDVDTRLNFYNYRNLGGTLNFDWKFSANTQLHWRTFFEDSERDGGRYRLRARSLSRWDASSTAKLESGKQVRLANQFENNNTKQDVVRLGLEGETRLPTGQLDYGVRYGDSTSKYRLDRYIFDMPSSTTRRKYSWTLDRTDPMLPVLSITNIATGGNGLLADLTDRTLSTIRIHRAHDRESDVTANVDYTLHQDLGERRIDWKVGTKYRSKDRSARPSITDYAPVTAPSMANFSVAGEPSDLFEGSMKTMGPFVSLPEVLNYFNANRSGFTAASGDEIVRLEARKYDVSEDILSGFAMGSTHIGKLEAIAGLRWEQTETGYTWLADPTGVSHGNRRYSNVHPSAVFNYRFNPNLVLRLAYTHTIARPNFGDLIPYRVLADTQAESGNGSLAPGDYPETNKVYLGNAALKAQKSENFDASVEYYLPKAGLLSVAVFQKNLSDVMFRSQWKDPAVPNTIYFQDRNGEKGKVKGIELSWQQALTFLPGPLNGLGVNVNATFTEGSSSLTELVPGTTATYRPYNVDFLPEQPKKVYNAQVWWEKYGITARVAVNHVGEYVRTSGGLTSFSMENAATRWDVSLSYRVTRNFTLYLEGRNLTNEVTAWYATTPSRPEDYAFNGATYSGGVKFRF